jgi:predicted DNA-binding transcriptional regulator AlpA
LTVALAAPSPEVGFMDRKQLAISQDIDALMDGALVRQFFGGKSKMTIHRWMNDPGLGFPQPIKIANQNYWTKRQLLEFVDRQRRKSFDISRSSTVPEA